MPETVTIINSTNHAMYFTYSDKEVAHLQAFSLDEKIEYIQDMLGNNGLFAIRLLYNDALSCKDPVVAKKIIDGIIEYEG